MDDASVPNETDGGWTDLSGIDWSNWAPVHHATLTFTLSGEQVLLIRKKRGLGAGKINGPGGKLEPGETILQCAVREVEEELGIIPIDLDHRGELRFQFTNGYSIHVHVFVAAGHRGEPRETEEAIPLWYAIDSIPYEEMWADDLFWLGKVLRGQSVKGDFLFNGDTLVDYHLENS